LARKTPLRKPVRGKEIISTKPRPKYANDFFSFIVLLCVCPELHNVSHTAAEHWSLTS